MGGDSPCVPRSGSPPPLVGVGRGWREPTKTLTYISFCFSPLISPFSPSCIYFFIIAACVMPGYRALSYRAVFVPFPLRHHRLFHHLFIFIFVAFLISSRFSSHLVFHLISFLISSHLVSHLISCLIISSRHFSSHFFFIQYSFIRDLAYLLRGFFCVLCLVTWFFFLSANGWPSFRRESSEWLA